MSTHSTKSEPHPNPHGRPRRKAFVVAALAASLVFGPALLAAPAAFAAGPPTADPAVVSPADPLAETSPTDSPAAPVDAAPGDSAPVDAAPGYSAPVDSAPVDAAPVDSAPVEAAPVSDSVTHVDATPSPATDTTPTDPAVADPTAVDPAAPVVPDQGEAGGTDPGLVIPSVALAFSLTSPAEGEVTNEFANLVFFDGTGTTDNTITVTYVNASGLTSTAGANVVDADGSFSVLTNFSELAGGQTDVSVVVTEADAGGIVVGAPIIRSFSFMNPPVPSFPFTVTSPAQGETVLTATPTFAGTGRPGDTIVIAYTDVDLEDSIAGEAVVAADGTFSVTTTFLRLPPGAVEVRTLSTEFGSSGVALVTGRIATLFYFGVAPVFAPNAPSITVVPGSLTVSDVTNTDRGVLLSATGFMRNEALTTTVTGPTGAATELRSTAAANADVNGSVSDVLVLSGTIEPGQYTVTVTGAMSDVTQTVSFTVVADPIVAPVVPVALVAPAAVAGVAINPPTTPLASLAATGTNGSVITGIATFAILFTLAGGAILVLRRKFDAGLSTPRHRG